MENNQGSLGSEAAQFTTAKTVVIPLCFLPLGLQKGVDKEFFLLFTVLDENKSWYSNTNQAAAMLDSRLLSEDAKGFQDSNRMHGMESAFTLSYSWEVMSKI